MPQAPAFSCTCNVCNKEIASGEGWRCGTCTDYDMCNACFLNTAVPRHEHQLVVSCRCRLCVPLEVCVFFSLWLECGHVACMHSCNTCCVHLACFQPLPCELTLPPDTPPPRPARRR